VLVLVVVGASVVGGSVGGVVGGYCTPAAAMPPSASATT
jgi:hypothetical protein